MSRVITGLGAAPAQSSNGSRSLTLSERFAAIAAQPDAAHTSAGWQTTSYTAPSAPAKQHSNNNKHHTATAAQFFNATSAAVPFSSAPVLPPNTSPTKQSRPARQLKLKGGSTVPVGAADSSATAGRKQRKVLLQREKRATTIETRRRVVKQTKQPQTNNSTSTNNNNNNGAAHNNKPKHKQQQSQQQQQLQPFNFVAPPFPSAFPSAFTAPFASTPFLPTTAFPSAFPSAFHPGTHARPQPQQQQSAGGRGGRGGVKAGGGRVKGGGGGAGGNVNGGGVVGQQRAGVKGKRGAKAALGTVARATGVVGHRAGDGAKGRRRKSGKAGGKAGGGANGAGGDVTTASLDSEMDLYHAGQ